MQIIVPFDWLRHLRGALYIDRYHLNEIAKTSQARTFLPRQNIFGPLNFKGAVNTALALFLAK